MTSILQLRINLESTNPEIYRQVQVLESTSFFELHHIIQIAMGWTTSHMHEFIVNGYHIGTPGEGYKNSKFETEILNDMELTLKLVGISAGDEFEYEYDFGDGWKHKITVEKVLEKDSATVYPLCIDGQLSCPSEDCGGIHGFYNMLAIIKNKTHPEYKETVQWLGKTYDPNKFEITTVNKKLSTIKKYIQKWLKDNY